jgi:hypothetical protein
MLFISFCVYLFPVSDFDGLMYHMPIVAHAIQNKSIHEVSAHIIPINTYPKNVEMIFLWSVLLPGRDTIVDGMQLIFAIIGTIALYGLSLRCHISRTIAAICAITFFFTPVVLMQARTTYVDVALSILFLLAAYTIASMEEFRLRMHSLFVGLATGLVIGTKGSGIMLGIALACGYLLMLISILRKKGDGLQGTALITNFLLFCFAIILTGGYFYIKNWCVYGNPIYPFAVKLLGIEIFKGTTDPYTALFRNDIPSFLADIPRWKQLAVSWWENTNLYDYQMRLGGFGPQWIAFLLPAIPFAIGYALYARNYTYVFLATMFGIAFFLHPIQWWSRHTIFIVGLGCISYGIVLQKAIGKMIPKIVICGGLVISLFYSVVIANFSYPIYRIKEFVALPSEERSVSKLGIGKNFGGLWDWVRLNVRQGDQVIFSDGFLLIYPFWNHTFSNHVKYVSGNNLNEYIEKIEEGHFSNNNRVWIILNRTLEEKIYISDKWRLVYSDDKSMVYGGT